MNDRIVKLITKHYVNQQYSFVEHSRNAEHTWHVVVENLFINDRTEEEHIYLKVKVLKTSRSYYMWADEVVPCTVKVLKQRLDSKTYEYTLRNLIKNHIVIPMVNELDELFGVYLKRYTLTIDFDLE